MSAPTALLPAARAETAAELRAVDARALDAVHDHVLRLLGDPEATAAVIADVAVRVSARAADEGATATSRTAMLRAAHTRLTIEERRRPSAALVAELAGTDNQTQKALVSAMIAAGLRGAALLDLTTRHGLGLRQASGVLGLDRSHAEGLRTDALRQVRAHLLEAGVALRTDVSAALAGLPVVGASPALHDRLTVPPGAVTRPAAGPWVAWLGTAAVAAATVGAVAVALPWVVSSAADDRPVVVAEQITEATVAEESTDLGDDGGVDDAGAVTVRAPVDEPVAEAEPEPEPPPEPSAEPSPGPEPSPEPTPEQSPEPQPEEEEEPSGPLDIDLPTGP